jgi:hypothetical protein
VHRGSYGEAASQGCCGPPVPYIAGAANELDEGLIGVEEGSAWQRRSSSKKVARQPLKTNDMSARYGKNLGEIKAQVFHIRNVIEVREFAA